MTDRSDKKDILARFNVDFEGDEGEGTPEKTEAKPDVGGRKAPSKKLAKLVYGEKEEIKPTVRLTVDVEPEVRAALKQLALDSGKTAGELHKTFLLYGLRECGYIE